MLSYFSHVQLFGTLWTIALQAPLSMGFSRQEYWSGLAFYPPRDLLDTGMEPTSPMSQNQGSRIITGWFLPRWDRHSVLEYPEDSYWEGAKLKPWLVKKLQSFKRARVCGCFIHSLVQTVLLFCLYSDIITRGPWLSWTITMVHQNDLIMMLTFCEIIYAQEKNTKASLEDAWSAPLLLGHEARTAHEENQGGSQNGTGRCQKQMFFSDPGCLCRGGILRVNTVFLSSISMISNPHLKRKRKKTEKTSGCTSMKPHSMKPLLFVSLMGIWLFWNVTDSKSDRWV